MARTEDEIRNDIRALVAELHSVKHAPKPFVPGVSKVPYAGRVFDEREIQALVDASLDFWLTLGPNGHELERRLAAFVGVKHASLVNSGSSANLLAISALTSPKLADRLRPGDEIVTNAAGFPTTLNPILQVGCVPVLVDTDPVTLNPDPQRIEDALSDRTRAVFLAHTLGNPFDLDAIVELCRRRGLFLVEDNCDALGSLWRGKPTGSFGHLSTCSFYPPHHMTMGEGGAVLTDDPKLRDVVESFRDWGRDCWCPSGQDGTCGKRFDWQLGDLPRGYDHKYVYGHVGYNLKPLDLQAAIGLVQLDKLPAFGEARRANWRVLADALAPLASRASFQRATEGSDPSWFGFCVTLADDCGLDRRDVVRAIEATVQTRMLFGGNLARQPAYAGRELRIPRPLVNADRVMSRSFFVGVYPGNVGAPILETARTLARVLG